MQIGRKVHSGAKLQIENHRHITHKTSIRRMPLSGPVGGQMANVLAFYSDDSSSNPAWVYSLRSEKKVFENNEDKWKRDRNGPISPQLRQGDGTDFWLLYFQNIKFDCVSLPSFELQTSGVGSDCSAHSSTVLQRSYKPNLSINLRYTHFRPLLLVEML